VLALVMFGVALSTFWMKRPPVPVAAAGGGTT